MKIQWLMVLAGAVLWPSLGWLCAAEKDDGQWKVGTPIVTYYAGPPMSEKVAEQMAEGGFNVVWCEEKDFALLQKHNLRGMLRDGLLAPATLENPDQKAKLDTLIDRVRKHPAMYSYYITDEPSAAAFAGLGKLAAHLKERDPAHMAYINLFPTYASNEQLGTKGDVETAYREHLRLYLETVKPMLVSYDHYQFMVGKDTTQYFLNLRMIRRATQDAGVPFLNIVQAASWQPGVRVPTADETRYLVYTTLAYGAQGISYYVYYADGHTGGIATKDGKPTPIFASLKTLNREFVAIAGELASLRSQGIYHTAMKEAGCEALPTDASATFRLEEQGTDGTRRGAMLGYFGPMDQTTHVLVVNLDYRAEARVKLLAPGPVELFDPATNKWSGKPEMKPELKLPPGGGKLLRVATSE